MPYKQKIVDFMKSKAASLPDVLRDIYFIEGDIESIMNNWTAVDAEVVCKTIAVYIDMHKLQDEDMCPFCIQADHHCNRCGYFQNHGICSGSTSDYAKIIGYLHGNADGTEGIMDYIIGEYGIELLENLKNNLESY